MTAFRPKYISFDCYGTLTRFRMGDMAREMFADRVAPDRMDRFVADFSAYRLDEVLGAWKPYAEVLKNALRRTCGRVTLRSSPCSPCSPYSPCNPRSPCSPCSPCSPSWSSTTRARRRWPCSSRARRRLTRARE